LSSIDQQILIKEFKRQAKVFLQTASCWELDKLKLNSST